MSTRKLSEAEWITKHGSGTLRFAYEMGTAYRQMYLYERVAFTFGGAFRLIPQSRFQCGAVLAEADCKPFTEGVWNIRRRKQECYSGDLYHNPKYITVTTNEGQEEGLGVEVDPVDCAWIPNGYIVYAIVSPAKNGKYTGEILCL